MSAFDKYNPNIIIDSANDKFNQGDVMGGQMVFQSALLDWVDDAREGVPGVDPDSLREATATLWLSYAEYLVQAKQWKSAMEAYEQAIACPVAGTVGRVYLEYARFAEERNKLNTAQDVYLRALVGGPQQAHGAVEDEQDRELIWSEFLTMMQKNNPDLTLRELQQAVEQEHLQGRPAALKQEEDQPDNVASLYDEMTNEEPVAKKPKVEESRTHVVTGDAVEVEATAFLESLQPSNLPQDISGAWIIRDGSDPPQPPENQLFSPSPPKLSDSSGKQLLGLDLALQLNKRMLEPSGPVLLDVCRSLWTLTSLKEKESKAAIDMIDETMIKEHERLEKTLEARMAVAGPTAHAVQQLNDNDRIEFKNACIQQRATVLAGVAWDMRNLLCIQQTILTKLKVPGFDGPTIEDQALDRHIKVCSYLHSAFYLRKRIGVEPHVTMVQKQVEKLEKELLERGPLEVQESQRAIRFQEPVSHYQAQQPHLPPPPMGIPPPPPPNYPQYNQGGYGAPPQPYGNYPNYYQ